MRILYHFTCGHVRDFHVGHFLCPICRKGKVATIEYACKICGAYHKTGAAAVKRLKYYLCPKCRKQYTQWRKSRKNGQALIDWMFERQLKKRHGTGAYTKINKHDSPCFSCEHVSQDKNYYPCNDCIRLKAWAARE